MNRPKSTKLSVAPARILPPADGQFRLRLACAFQPREEGIIGIDSHQTDSVDYIVDLKSAPWPIDDNLVDFIYAAHYLHRLTNPERWLFMNECHRVLKPGSQLQLAMPHWSSMRAITDPLAQWPPLCESSFMMYSAQWREQEKMTDLPLTCDFGSAYGYGHQVDPNDAQFWNDDRQQFAKKHYLNAILDLHVTLTKSA